MKTNDPFGVLSDLSAHNKYETPAEKRLKQYNELNTKFDEKILSMLSTKKTGFDK